VTSFVFEVGNSTSHRNATAMLIYPTGCLVSCTTTTTTLPGATTTTSVPQTSTISGVSAFTLGTSLVDFSNPYVDSLLSQYLGASTAEIKLLSSSGLAGADVSIGDILAANPSVGGLSNLLDTPVSPGTALGYYYNALVAQNTTPATNAAGSLSSSLAVSGTGAGDVTTTSTVELCQLINLTNGTTACNAGGSALTPAAFAQINAADYLIGVADLAHEQHAVGINISGLGLLNVTATAISPVAEAGPGPADEPSCPTGAAICPVTANESQAAVTLSLANLSLGLGTTVNIELQVTGASASGTLQTLDCGTSLATETATISGSSSAATISPTFTVTALGIPSTLTGSTSTVGGASFTDTFTGPFGDSLPAAQSQQTSNPSIVVNAPSGLTGAVLSTLTTDLNNALDPALSPILSGLGINLGNSTVTDQYVNCSTTQLVG
jgi:hypothetical protein